MIITRLGEMAIEAEILLGPKTRKKIIIPRIIMTTAETNCPYKMKRRQYPIRVCYVMTINKSQGQSLENVGIFLSKQSLLMVNYMLHYQGLNQSKDYIFGAKARSIKRLQH